MSIYLPLRKALDLAKNKAKDGTYAAVKKAKATRTTQAWTVSPATTGMSGP